MPAIAYCLLQEVPSATDNSIPQRIALAAEIHGFIGTNFEYGHAAYMRSLVHDEIDALLAPWPQAAIAAAQVRGQKTAVWEIAEAVWGFIQKDATQYPSHNTDNLNSASDNIPMAPDSPYLLGTFQLIHHGHPITLGQPRLEELLSLLALRPGTPVARTQIAYHFWPDSSERQARTNARNLLYKLRQIWPQVDEVIDIGRTEVTWRADAGITLDIQIFLGFCNKADEVSLPTERIALLADAVACYSGELLPSSYAEWVLTEREQLRLRFVTALEALIEGLLELRRYDEALQRATQLRNHDPMQEASYRRLMQIHALLGDRVAALRVYHECVSMLEKELGVEPSPATSQLHAQLVQRSPATDKAAASAVTERPRLIGRHAEWQQLQQIWRTVQAGKAHMGIIWGEAGIGKTRLAEEMLDWVQRLGHVHASSRSYAAQGALSYAPITEWLRAPTIHPALSGVDDLYRVEVARLLPELWPTARICLLPER